MASLRRPTASVPPTLRWAFVCEPGREVSQFFHGRDEGIAVAVDDLDELVGAPAIADGLTLLVGLVAGAVFCARIPFLRLDLPCALVEAVFKNCSPGQAIFLARIVVAALLQGGIAAIVAGWVPQFRALHGLYAAFVAGCVITVGMVGLYYLQLGMLLAFSTFYPMVYGGALVALPAALITAIIGG